MEASRGGSTQLMPKLLAFRGVATYPGSGLLQVATTLLFSVRPWPADYVQTSFIVPVHWNR
eukprot:scaffold3410_cov141-Cylindrotheca_fusiformis.AAC.2